MRTSTNYAHDGTWATKPSASSVQSGTKILVTDVGAFGKSEWRSDGSLWRPVAQIKLMQYVNSTTGLVFAAGGAEQAFGTELPIPATVFYPGAILRFRAMYGHGTVSESRGVRVRWGATSGALTTVVHGVMSSSASAQVVVDKSYSFYSTTELMSSPVTGIGPATASTASAMVTLSGLTSAGFLNFTATPSASNAVTVQSADLTLEP